MSDFLLLINTLLGVFAGLANGYLAFQIHPIHRRIFWGGISLMCTAMGMMYGAAMLGYVGEYLLGPQYLRPMTTTLMTVLVFAPFANWQDGMATMEKEIGVMRQELLRQSEEIERLNQVIKTLVKQFGWAGPLPLTTPLPTEEPKPLAPTILVAAVESSGLKVREEVDAIFDSGIHYEYLPPPVSRNRLISEMERLKPKAVHLLGHMNAEGMVLADGMVLVGWWRRLFERYGVQFLFANGCESLDIVDALFVDGVQCVIGVRGDVQDASALEFARQFYAWLAAGRMATEAVDLAKLSLGHVDAEQVVIRGEWSYR